MIATNLVLIASILAAAQMTLAQEPALMPMPPKPILIPASHGEAKLSTRTANKVVYHELTITGESARPLFNSLPQVVPIAIAGTTKIVKKRGENAECQSTTPKGKPESLSCDVSFTDGLFTNFNIKIPKIGKPKPLPTTVTDGKSSGQATPHGVLVTVSGVVPKEKAALEVYNSLKVKAVEDEESTAVTNIMTKAKNNMSCSIMKTKADTLVICNMRFVEGKAVVPTK